MAVNCFALCFMFFSSSLTLHLLSFFDHGLQHLFGVLIWYLNFNFVWKNMMYIMQLVIRKQLNSMTRGRGGVECAVALYFVANKLTDKLSDRARDWWVILLPEETFPICFMFCHKLYNTVCRNLSANYSAISAKHVLCILAKKSHGAIIQSNEVSVPQIHQRTWIKLGPPSIPILLSRKKIITKCQTLVFW